MFILDSYALLCLFDKKESKGNRAIRRYLDEAEKGKVKLFLSKMNEGEIFCKLYKYIGEEFAVGFREDLKRGIIPVGIVSVDDKRVERASEIKARYPVSYADAFCIELAMDMKAPIITGDPEYRSIGEKVEVKWIG